MAELGRPTDYREEYNLLAGQMWKQGATDAEVADVLRVTLQTLHTWKAKYPAFLEAQKVSKDFADNRVERSLYSRATGYTFDSEKVFCKDGIVTRVETREHVPPDVTAQIFWLKNRRPQEWRDSQATGNSLSLNVSGPLAERLIDQLTGQNLPSSLESSNSPIIDAQVIDNTSDR